MKIEIRVSETVSASQWQTLLSLSDDVWMYHVLPWLEMTADVYGLKNFYFTVWQNDDLIGGLPVQIFHTRRYRRSLVEAHSSFMGPAGPCWKKNLPHRVQQRAMLELTSTLAQWLQERQVAYLVSALPPLAAANLHRERGVNPLALGGWRDTSTHTCILDLSVSQESLWTGLSENAKRKIRSAQKAGYSVQEESWPEMLFEYYNTHVETYQRTGVPPHQRAYFEGVANHIAGLKMTTLWVARDANGQPVAFHNSARFGEGAFYWTGCSRTAHLETGVNYLLFWQAITGAKEAGFRWYDVGEVFPDAQSGKLKSLSEFKTKFGGEIHRFYRGELQGAGAPAPSLLWKVGSAARNKGRQWLQAKRRETRDI